MVIFKNTYLVLRTLLFVTGTLCSVFAIAADPLEPYQAITKFSSNSSTLSSGCVHVNANVPGLAEALSIDFKLDSGALVISDVKAKDRRPLIGCEDLLDVSLDAQGNLTSALYSTSQLTIEGGDSAVYNLSASFSEARKPIAQSGQYLFDAITYSERSCSDLTKNAIPVAPIDYMRDVRSMIDRVYQRSKTGFQDTPDSLEETTYGPVSHWFYEEALAFASNSYLTEFNDFAPDGDEGADGFKVTWQNYQNYMGALCNVYTQKDSKASLYQQATIFANVGLGFPGHTANWPQFEYIETGRKVIASPSPAGLEYYTKYATGAGIIIVAGSNVDDEALLHARDAFIYMTSAKPEMRGILQRNHARASLFVKNASELPEFGPEFADQNGGFAQGNTDANFTANATWQCYPGNLAVGGHPAVHELGHVINHLVFEETNEMYWYSRVAKFAKEARDNGTMPQNSPLGEYWAQAVEGYIMNKGEAFKGLFPSREDIAKNHPGIYDLLTRYLPTEPWDYCTAYDPDEQY
jgi:hypothetical protein